ncbi:hypothetical protein CPC08DRAFT_705482 [Agrocybe pediades]|nr:hypothetical protein CPC08DRAFT_705482 [Agrocybe pediades]
MKKKRSQKEQKFLQDAEKELKEANARTAQEIQDAVNEIEQVYKTFLLEYAACEDNIRKKWEEIQQEQEKLTKAVKERLRRDEEAVKVASSMHVEGLTKTKRSLKAFQETIDQLIPTQ